MGIMSVSMKLEKWYIRLLKFPSPMGIMSVSMEIQRGLIEIAQDVSVPYGDHVCLNTDSLCPTSGALLVSVPYGDHVCLNDVQRVYRTMLKHVSVPYGDHVCLNIVTVSVRPYR